MPCQAYDAAVEREGQRAATLLSEAPGASRQPTTDASKIVKAAASRDRRRALPSDASAAASDGPGDSSDAHLTGPTGHRVYNFLGGDSLVDDADDDDDAELMASLARARRLAADKGRRSSKQRGSRAAAGASSSVLDAVKKLGESNAAADATSKVRCVLPVVPGGNCWARCGCHLTSYRWSFRLANGAEGWRRRARLHQHVRVLSPHPVSHGCQAP